MNMKILMSNIKYGKNINKIKNNKCMFLNMNNT